MIPSEVVERMKCCVDFIPVCPEVGIGLGVPRDPIRIVRTGAGDRLVQPATGRDLTEEMDRFAREFLDGLPPVDGFILKSRSPSSGKTGAKVYPDATGSSPVGKGPGIFGRAVLARFGRFPVEEEGRLRNPGIRDHFLAAVFTLARFRRAKERGKIRDLARFHAENQLLLTALNEGAMRDMGGLVANREGKTPRELFAVYEDLLLSALRRPPRRTAIVRILAHAGGSFRDRPTRREWQLFGATLGRYRAGLVPVDEPKGIILSWIARSGDPDLEKQTFFFPYPEELRIPGTGVQARKRLPSRG